MLGMIHFIIVSGYILLMLNDFLQIASSAPAP